jgi:hypothetical protein
MQAPYGPAFVPNAPTEGKANLSLILGIIAIVTSCCYIGFIVGIPAMILGGLSRRDIRRSNGALGGAGNALAGMITGGIGAAINLVQIGFVVFGAILGATSKPTTPPSYPYPAYPPVATAPTATATDPAYAPPSSYGDVHVVTLDATSTLKDQLHALALSASAEKKKLVVITVASWSKDASEIEQTIPDARMQGALEGAWLARVDADAFKSELAPLGMDKPDVPWFFLVDSTPKVVRSLSANEWSANTAANIAPALRRFVDGTSAPPAPSGSVLKKKPGPGGTPL